MHVKPMKFSVGPNRLGKLGTLKKFVVELVDYWTWAFQSFNFEFHELNRFGHFRALLLNLTGWISFGEEKI